MVCDLRDYIVNLPDHPVPGVTFRDITPLLLSRKSFDYAVTLMAQEAMMLAKRREVHAIAAIEARGFIFGAAIATVLDCGFIPLRKPGKLPRETYAVQYELEYGSAELHMHKIDLSQENVLLVDDVLATGGTARAACQLLALSRATVLGALFLIELPAILKEPLPVETRSLLRY